MPATVRFMCSVRFAKILIDVREDDGTSGRRMVKKLFVDLHTETTLPTGKVLKECFVVHLYKRGKNDAGELRFGVPTYGRHNDKGESMRADDFEKTYAARRWGADKARKMVKRVLTTFEEEGV